jgi:CheY-like chemotaxis protein
VEHECQRQVLIVDDDPDMQECLIEILSDEGYRCEVASNGALALEHLRRAQACVILLDAMMPVMDGWQFRDAQLQDQRIAHIPVILMTANHQITAAISPQGVRTLTKPVRLAELLSLVQECCSRS